MAIQKPSIPKGTRDFTPSEMARRNYIFSTIRNVFERYGYLPIETPAVENLSTLMGKYGEEGDRLLFKIINSGNYLEKAGDDFSDYKKLLPKISEKGLRYDLTVPFARFVVMHQHEITFPFKRSQIQPVWRADRPQKGRYREFYQCDADVIGSNSLLNEAELLAMISDVFSDLKINVVIKINNRKILSGIAELIGQADKITDITVAIDKLDKIGIENVNKELLEKGICEEDIQKLQPIIMLQGTTEEKLEQMKQRFSSIEVGMKGVEELEKTFKYCKSFDLKFPVELDLTLARGLNYYTGIIIEVKALDVNIGSITGGGRYDDLTGIFGLKEMSGVGISFGADRIYDVLNETHVFPAEIESLTKILFLNFGEKEENFVIPLLLQVRKQGISAELYPDDAKIKKQMNYANQRNIPVVAIVGESEMENNSVQIKNMINGTQTTVPVEQMMEEIIKNI
ncbi:MAG: histidine--tRNA ligase [Bacteroidales bacterium]|nr:histidine--tRNA ligase [Bacteroidales bacterium]